MWWVREILQKNHARNRPKIMELHRTDNVDFSGILVMNSPYYHIVPYDCENWYMHDFEIYVDIVGQLELHNLFLHNYPKELMNFGGLDIEIPIFPLNTDGVDIYGRNFTFRNVKITNFDDAIVPKPSNKGHKHVCTEDIWVEDCEVTWGVGMTIGSVPPNTQHACIKNVTFKNIVFNKPLKGIYVKTNPGE
jgi:polygalacturonase